MKTFNKTNFFKHTFCEFQQVDDFEFIENINYKSKSESVYFYTEDGVYRKSNHWGRVANCRWKLISTENYKNQQVVIGFAKWTNFYPIHSSDKIFSIQVDFAEKSAKLQPKKKHLKIHFFTFSEAQKRIKQINHLFKDHKWAKYYEKEIEELRFEIISEFIHSDKTLKEIKRSFK